ncbi:hypothetical protein QJS04_geneDACA003045 [Acorus gramineus]|uniref:Uncharacterized protein n=1 Tax=Acorus gramineus TaxID=55184 RepID=A0AAV9BWK8_ACOGR|nr:hypothetical protein QJS04_geneDACA003045 [Acorus gramineus]
MEKKPIPNIYKVDQPMKDKWFIEELDSTFYQDLNAGGGHPGKRRRGWGHPNTRWNILADIARWM